MPLTNHLYEKIYEKYKGQAKDGMMEYLMYMKKHTVKIFG